MGISRKVAAAALGTAVVLPALTASLPALAEEITIQMWQRADRSGPLRAGNIVRAAEVMNRMFEASGSETRVNVEVYENNQPGFDADALDLLQAFAVDRGPDIYVASHTWLAEFADAGYAMNLEEHIAANPQFYDDVIDVFWEAVSIRGERYAIPQDSEIRMIFYNKNMLRELGYDEEFIDGIPAMVETGEMTIWEFGELAREVVDAGVAQYGLLHRPNVGPDYIMTFRTFGVDFYDANTGDLLLPLAEMEEAFSFFDWMARNGATPENNTAMAWDDVQSSFKQELAFSYHHGIWTLSWQLGDDRGNTWPETEEEYFDLIGWIHMPAAEEGGRPTNLTHPIVYVVNPQGDHPELAAQLVGLATLPYFNTEHAVTTNHTAILYGQSSMPAYTENWVLSAGAEMLPYTSFQPNHSQFARYNGLIYTALQGVETGRLTPAEAVEFLADEVASELGDAVVIIDSMADLG